MLLQLRAKRPQHHLIIPEHLHGFQYLLKLMMLCLELVHLLLLFGLPVMCPLLQSCLELLQLSLKSLVRLNQSLIFNEYFDIVSFIVIWDTFVSSFVAFRV